MTTIIMLGGNGYLGREISRQWLALDSQARIYTLSRSGKNSLQDERIINIAADLQETEAVLAQLPMQADYVLNLVGAPAKTEEQEQQINVIPAQAAERIARATGARAIGFIGGLLGPKAFLETKKELTEQLRASGIRVEVVEPTLIYGADRSDALAKMVPLFKFLGLFAANMKPVLVQDVAAELIEKLTR
ncbi:MAG: NAD-dependent epimerase/dehydratase family protein [Rothia sp. (in: high G+C Gram-positive bacteria)]|uniref:NAD-dependent epimerase/dehydratase family protein n=1 Tax=Rothia sp. (in: high G+C Gram-positive bacteria) TaxID=1885016 RepID=UPI0026DFDF51|nr:NAD-dependent epimerase/dehydratase family protein [Rothia sp. (in: high G+C Gram-positive bacteria)]MDO5750929.1 NAD-dependent epimerase/dehydratase family protein [Rothia sp. (in: high G+C Gram-positive bacteria)]